MGTRLLSAVLSMLVVVLLMFTCVSYSLYVKPIVIIERSGHYLINYTIHFTYNFTGLVAGGYVSPDFSNLAFITLSGKYLPYYVTSIASPVHVLPSVSWVYAVVGDVVYFGNSSGVYVYNISTGTVRELLRTSSLLSMDSLYFNGNIYIVGRVGNMPTLIVVTPSGEVSEVENSTVSTLTSITVWNRTITIGTASGDVFTINSTVNPTWRPLFKCPHDLPVAELSTVGDVLYVLCMGNLTYMPGIALIYALHPDGSAVLMLNLTGKVMPIEHPVSMDALGKTLYIAIANSSDNMIHVLAYGEKTVNYVVDIPVSRYVYMSAEDIDGETVLILATEDAGQGRIYAYFPRTMTIVHVLDLDSDITWLKHYQFSNSTLVLALSTTYGLYIARLYSTVNIWIRISRIDPYGRKMILMVYDFTNSTAGMSNPEKVFMWYDDFNEPKLQPEYVPFGGAKARLEDSCIVIRVTSDLRPEGVVIKSPKTFINRSRPIAGPYILVTVRMRILKDLTANDQIGIAYYWQNSMLMMLVRYIRNTFSNYYGITITNFYPYNIAVGTKVAAAKISDLGTGWFNLTFIDYMNGTVEMMLITQNGETYIIRGTQNNLTWGYIGLFAGWADTNNEFLFDKVMIRAYTYPEPEIEFGSTVNLTVTLPLFTVLVRHLITYVPASDQISTSIAYSVNSSVVSITGSGYVVTVSASPYINDSGWLVPTQNSTIYGTWIGGSLSSLSSMDYNYLSYESYNNSNTMVIVLQFNITGLGWLVSDSRVTIKSITVKVAGNLSKTVNTIAGLEIYNFTGNTWQLIDPAALNQTVDTEKTYSLTGNLRDLISSSGIIMLKITIIDVQSYPSTPVTLDLDELKILITYQNASDVEAVHTVTISLPYGGVNVSRLVLYARYGGNPLIASARVYIYNSTGRLVATSTLNVSSTWTRNSVVIDRYMKSIEIILVTYIESSPSEESNISIGYVEVYTNHSSWIRPTCVLVPGSRYFNCSLVTDIELGSPGMVNSSTLYIYVIDKLRNVSISYPAPATYVSTVSMSGRTYNVYEIENALNETELRLSSLLENTYVNGTWNVTVHGRDLDYAVVGDRVCIGLPEPGNITIITVPTISVVHVYNIDHLCTMTNSTGGIIVIVTRNITDMYSIGYGMYMMDITYGKARIKLRDLENRSVTYVPLRAVVHGKHGTYVANGTGQIELDTLYAGNYTAHIYYIDVPVGKLKFTVTSLTPTVDVTASLHMLNISDYVKSRVVAWSVNASLIRLESLSSDYPYSRMYMLFNGSHGEKFCIAMTYAKKPTRVEVLTNGSEMYYDWIGNTLRICERMRSPTYVETIDMYMLRIVLVDMLNRTLSFPVPIHVNGIKHVGNIVTMFVTPGTYVIDVSREYTYGEYRFTLVNKSRIVVHVNDSDVVLRIVYRVPLKISAEVVSIAPGIAYVTGRAVDYRNSPVPDLTLIIVEKCSNGTEIDSDVVTTGADGSFISKPFKVPKCGAIFNITYFGSETYEPAYTVVKLGVAPRRVVSIRLNLLLILALILAITIIVIAIVKLRHTVFISKRMFRY